VSHIGKPHGRIGEPTPQHQAVEKVRGRAVYVRDMTLPGMLHGRVLRSPHARARIVNVDLSRALRVRGVRTIITGADIPPATWGPIAKDQTTLARGVVRYAGEEVAAVAAASDDAAQEAIEAIRVDYEAERPVLDPRQAVERGCPRIHEDRPNLAREVAFSRGDVQAGFAAADVIYEATYELPYQYHGYTEPMGTLASPDSSGRLTLWAPTQSVFYTRELVAEAIGVPVSRVRVIQTVVGGAFGGKIGEENNSAIAALLALKAGRPVRLINDRPGDFAAARKSLPAIITLKIGVTRDGRLVAKEMDVLADNGAYSGLAPEQMVVTAMRCDNLYRTENLSTRGRLVYTNNQPSGTFRAFGTQQAQFAMDSHLAVLADMIDMDLVELLRRNVIQAGDTSVHGWVMNSCGLTDCINAAAREIGWAEKYRAAPGAGRTRRGVGIGIGIHVTANRQLADWDGATVALKMNEDGSVNLISGEGDLGQGASTVLAELAAAELGVPFEDIVVSQADTDVVPFAFGSFASRTTLLAGNATIRAARQVREKLLNMAAERLEISESDLDIADGWIFVKGSSDIGVTVAEACRAHLFRAGGDGIYERASYDAPTVMYDPETLYGNVAPAYSFAAQAVEVEVDTLTGVVRLIRSVVADDVGRALNPLAVEGQICGAVAQGVGWALFEQMRFEDGRLLTDDFRDYTMPVAEALPDLETVLVESIEPNGPLGAKGASETAIVPTAGAIANAVAQAVGARVQCLPITGEKLLAAMLDAQTAKAAEVTDA
jgi:CO/xanthine dehydrogenase Mo-binding subunit